jgi:hypothetical protein
MKFQEASVHIGGADLVISFFHPFNISLARALVGY